MIEELNEEKIDKFLRAQISLGELNQEITREINHRFKGDHPPMQYWLVDGGFSEFLKDEYPEEIISLSFNDLWLRTSTEPVQHDTRLQMFLSNQV